MRAGLPCLLVLTCCYSDLSENENKMVYNMTVDHKMWEHNSIRVWGQFYSW